MFLFWCVAGGLAAVAATAAAVFLWLKSRQHVDAAALVRARAQFHQQREWLEAKFLTRNRDSGKPRGLTWVDCEFADPVCFARDRHSNELRALVAVSIRFEAVEGGGMEDNPNVHNVRAATAVFHFGGGQWTTDGRTVFNKNPAETIRHFQHELEPVE